MSAAFLVCASVALLLLLLLLVSLAALRRMESAAGDGLEDVATRGERHRGPSSDVHLFLGFDEAAAAARIVGTGRAERTADALPALVASLREGLLVASHALVEYGHFREVSVRSAPSLAVVYVHLRLRSAVDATFAASDPAAWSVLLDTLERLGPPAVVELRVARASRTTDPASPELVRLDRSPA